MNAEPADLTAFLELVNERRGPAESATAFFLGDGRISIARAPGRLDLMGGIADYSGSLVLEYPLQDAAFAAVQLRRERMLRVASVDPSGQLAPRELALPLSEFETGRAASYEAARRFFAADRERSWAAYVAGVVPVLMRERRLELEQGLDVLIASSVPEGKGVASSAAVEVATMQALAGALDIELGGVELAVLCQKVEHELAGAPCGLMDQLTASLGREGRCLLLECQPAKIVDQLRLPEGAALFGIDSGVRHAVSGSDYVEVRTGAFMGYRMIAARAGFATRVSAEGRVEVDDPRFGGYLANLTPAEFEREFAGALPERLAGREFLERYQGTTDSVTRVDPDKSYPVRYPTAHPVYENARVREFARLLAQPASEASLQDLGQLMFQAHDSYGRCELGSQATDELVRLVKEGCPGSGLYGAKITGGGSGGTVAVLARAGVEEAVTELAARYSALSGRKVRVFRGSSDGATAFGIRRLAAWG